MGNAPKNEEDRNRTRRTKQNEKRVERLTSRKRCMNSYLLCSLTLSDLEEMQNCLQDRTGNGKERGKFLQKYFYISSRFFFFSHKIGHIGIETRKAKWLADRG